LVVPAFVTDALMDQGFAALPLPGEYPTYVESPYVDCPLSAPEYLESDECEPW
jgi:hypothetical protein